MTLLKGILNAIQSLEDQSEDTELFVTGHRNCRTYLVNHVLTDLTKKLSSTKSAGEFDIALSLIEHCEAPPIPNIFSFKDEKSKDFAFWIQSRLLRIYASSSHTTHHEKTVKVHNTILSVVKELDSEAFIQLISRLVKLLSDLCSGSDTGKPYTCCVSEVDYPEPVSASDNPLEEQSMTRIDLELSQLSQLEPLQISVMKLIETHISTILEMAPVTCLDNLISSLCWHIECSRPVVKSMTCRLMTRMFSFTGWIDRVPQLLIYNLMACLEVIVLYAMESADRDLTSSVSELLQTLCKLEAHHTIQLSMMLVESITDTAFTSPEDSKLTSSVFELLYLSASRTSILSKAMCKLLTEWMLTKIQSNLACKSMIHCLGDLINSQPSDAALTLLASLSTAVLAAVDNRLSCGDGDSLVDMVRHCCQVICHCYKRLGAKAKTDSLQDESRGLKCLLDTLTNFWKVCLKDASDDKIATEYTCMCDSVSSLLCLQDILTLDKKITQAWLSMISLPWLHSQAKAAKDYGITLAADLRDVMSTLKPLISDQIVSASLISLIMFSEEQAGKWRVHVMRTVCGTRRPALLATITSNLRWILIRAGKSAHHLIYDLLHPMLTLQSSVVDESLSASLGNLVCITAGTVTVTWSDTIRCHTPVWEADCIICQHCSTGGDDRTLAQFVDPGMFEPFIQLVQKSNTVVRLAMAQNLHALFSHIKIFHANGETIKMFQTALGLLQDESYEVRSVFSSLPHKAFQGSSMEVIGQIVDRIVTINATVEDETVKETLIMTIQSLGRLDDENLFPICIRFLVESYLSLNQHVSVTAYHHLQKLAELRNLTATQVYQMNQNLLAECLSEKVNEVLSANYNEGLTVMDLFINASKLFNFESVTVFLRAQERRIIPFLVTCDHSEIHQVLKMIASQVGKSYQQLLTTNIKYVFSHLIRYCDRLTFERKISYLEKESRLSIGSLLRQSFQGVLNRLLLYFGPRHQQIKLGLAFFLSQDGQSQITPGTQVTNEQLAEFIEKHLLGVLVFFDQILLGKSYDVQTKENVVASLMQIIKLLGAKHITPLRIKVSTSLKLALKVETDSMHKLCADAWLCFIQHVDVSALKTMLSFIVVTLLPLLRIVPVEVAQVFKYLVITCKKQLNESFRELYFIPDIPELTEVNAVLKNYMIYSGRHDAFSVQLKQYMSGIKHDNMEVCKQALHKLKNLLLDNKPQLHTMISGAETVDPLITDVMVQLTSGCVKADDEMRLLYADCLAVLGAIDPGKMITLPTGCRENKTQKNLDDINSPNFLMLYLDVLVTALLSADTTLVQDCIALAIQGALSLYDIRNDEGNDVWTSLTAETQDIISPYLESKYIMSDPNWLKVDSPVYMSSRGKSFTAWLCNWTALLASKITDGFALQLFRSNMAAISASVNLAVFILPYVVTYVLAEGQAGKLIHDEIMIIVEDSQQHEMTELCHVTLQTVFSVIDDLKAWLNKPKPRISKVAATGAQKEPEKISVLHVRDFLSSFPHDQIARSSLHCKNYARALLHYELHMEGSDIQDHLDTLQEIYSCMDEPDGVAGVDAIRNKPATLHQQAIVWQNVDNVRDAMVCYEEAINIDPTDITAHEGLMKSYLNLGNWYLALSHNPSVPNADSSLLDAKLVSYKVEAAWKLCDWDVLRDKVGSCEDNKSLPWSVGLGKLILAAKDKQQDTFNETMKTLKKDIMGPLSAASMESGSSHRGYPYLVQLHMLGDIESAAQLCLFKSDQEKHANLDTLINLWSNRFDTVQSSVRTTEPLVTLRQSLLQLTQQELPNTDLRQQIQNCWLERASIARKANQLVNAYGSLEKGARYGLAEREVEKAKLFWHRGDRTHAQTCLDRIINSHYGLIDLSEVKKKPRKDQISHAEVYLLYAWYNEGNSKFERAEVMKHYKKAIEVCHTWEAAYFKLAVYYEKYLASRSETQAIYWRVYKQTISNYALSVRYGSKNVYQSMSRAITLWLDLGSDIATKKMKERMNNETREILKHQVQALTQIHSECIEPMKENVPGFQWLTSFSQLVSRLCHAHGEVTILLQELIANLIVQYPQQTVWNMMAISKSSFPIRLQRCQDTFDKAKSKSPALHIFFKDIIRLTDRLLELTNKSVEPRTYHMNLSEHFRYLKRLLDDPNFSEIMLPTQSAMTVTLPAQSDITGIPTDHNAFPSSLVYLSGFQDRVEILSSMIRPKKLTIIGSDGKSYPFLCKPKDDLRKDGRLMEFNSVINKLLRKDPQSRRMQLYIKTYAVVPLSEECGLLEWINNTCPYRTIMNGLYKERGCYVSMTECMAAYRAFNNKSSADTRLPIFRQMRDKYPPILHEWFLRNFPDPTSWYNARVCYARTLAVMSVVGYVVGLGDRHGENILLDATTGGVMHVDFNCLFNKGLSFDWPEVVPFRLTHNMVAAMGPMGYEGIFRKSAEVTLRVMKQEKDQLMSILRPFIYDPLVEWSKPQTTAGKRKGKHQSETGEVTNEQAMSHVQTIENRLTEAEGGQDKGLQLSIEGHVEDLISEATDERNLARMYVGWAAFF